MSLQDASTIIIPPKCNYASELSMEVDIYKIFPCDNGSWSNIEIMLQSAISLPQLAI